MTAPDPEDAVYVSIRSEADIVTARQEGRRLAAEAGFTAGEQALIATAISELARNIVVYAGKGEVVVSRVRQGQRRGVTVVAEDNGPGIPDIELAMRDGYSTTRSLGLGLPGARRLMDDFDIRSTVGEGTTVTVTKWKR